MVLFAYNIIAFILPISGFGLHQSLIRYGSLANSTLEKNKLFVYVFKKGIVSSFVIIFLIIVTSFFINFQFVNTRFYIILLSFLILPSFLLEIIRAQLRLNYNNKLYSFTEIVQSFLLIVSVLVLSFFFKEVGYAIALLFSPLLTALFFINKLNINFKIKEKLWLSRFSFWKYGFFASLSNVVTQLLFVIDILLIGYLLNSSELVTDYRYISLIPFSLLFLPRVFITTDFVAFTEKINNKKFIKNYIKSYLLLFSIISFLLFFTSWFLAEPILYLFDENFIQYKDVFTILIFGVTGIFILRGLFGNLLSSLGKAHINYYIASIAVLINIVSNYILIPKYSLLGAAITSALLMWFTGIASCILFYYYYKKTTS